MADAPWIECPTLDFDLDRPMREQYENVSESVFARSRELLRTIMEEVPSPARLLADAIRLRTRGRFHAQVIAVASAAGVSWREIVIANVIYDLVMARIGCSTAALATADGPVLARNMDFWPEDILARNSYLIRNWRNGTLELANAGWPGAIGVVTGLSGRGFAIALNAVSCPEGTNRAGYPVLLHIRRVLEDAEDFATAVRTLSETTLATPCLLTAVGAANDERVVIERSPKRHAHRWGEPNRPLVATNHYRVLYADQATGATRLDETTCSRHEALSALARQHEPKATIADEQLLHWLSDPSVLQSITAQHVLIRPRSGEIRLFVPRALAGGDPPGPEGRAVLPPGA